MKRMMAAFCLFLWFSSVASAQSQPPLQAYALNYNADILSSLARLLPVPSTVRPFIEVYVFDQSAASEFRVTLTFQDRATGEAKAVSAPCSKTGDWSLCTISADAKPGSVSGAVIGLAPITSGSLKL